MWLLIGPDCDGSAVLAPYKVVRAGCPMQARGNESGADAFHKTLSQCARLSEMA